ncbi:hypothetical protein HNE_1356 [Hyphomonas neptunium ATCC 15444]|uniref:Lipoprotein n=2 Tax=Hyphomonas TaxID=85 RepID=Q0C2H0_HYPNA|nr:MULTISPECIES: hypothetical protein [Hyphomonas]ABI76952.1 hypothetical protein HNE_1356 [Hyphomonas neptunium ATCC 15444]KCZ95692.1 hypothetical protein HHI_02937 [Hyphomonas hirschiana VP5]
MKKLLASCAVVALMAAPALAQSTIDPTTPDTVPVEPQIEQPADDLVVEPQTETMPEALPPEPDMAEEAAPPTPDAEPMMEAETETEAEAEDESYADAEDDSTLAETEEDDSFADTNSDPVVTAEVAAPEAALEASVDEAELPEDYSTDDLNAMMLAQVNTVGSEITELDSEADAWVSANGAPVDPAYAPEGQGDMEVTTENEAPVTEGDDSMTPETEAPEADSFVEPEVDPMTDDDWTNENPVDPEMPSDTEY